MSIRKRIAALGAAAVMAASMCAMGASADFTNYFHPNGQLTAEGFLVNSTDYKYKMNYKKAKFDCSASFTIPKNSNAGEVRAYYCYWHNGCKLNNFMVNKSFPKKNANKAYVISKRYSSFATVKSCDRVWADFRVKTDISKLEKKTVNASNNVTYYN